MTKLIYAGIDIELEAGQTVLSALLDNGHSIPNNCRIGICQTCLMQAVVGTVPTASQRGLKDTLRAQNYFLACQCTPTAPLEIILPDSDMACTTAKVMQVQKLSPDVLQLQLKPETTFEYQAGQYVMIRNSQELGRCYSLASVPGLDDLLELHVARVAGGRMSGWLFDVLNPGDHVQLQTAAGDCFYVEGNPEQNLLLAGTGTGLAPLWGILRDALHQGHRGEIHLIHGAIHTQGLYLHDALLELDREFDNFFYHASVLNGDDLPGHVSIGHIEALITRIAPKPNDWKIYLCGAQEIVNSLKKKVFLAGASMTNIYSDPFVSAPDSNDVV